MEKGATEAVGVVAAVVAMTVAAAVDTTAAVVVDSTAVVDTTVEEEEDLLVWGKLHTATAPKVPAIHCEMRHDRSTHRHSSTT